MKGEFRQIYTVKKFFTYLILTSNEKEKIVLSIL